MITCENLFELKYLNQSTNTFFTVAESSIVLLMLIQYCDKIMGTNKSPFEVEF